MFCSLHPEETADLGGTLLRCRSSQGQHLRARAIDARQRVRDPENRRAPAASPRQDAVRRVDDDEAEVAIFMEHSKAGVEARGRGHGIGVCAVRW